MRRPCECNGHTGTGLNAAGAAPPSADGPALAGVKPLRSSVIGLVRVKPANRLTRGEAATPQHSPLQPPGMTTNVEFGLNVSTGRAVRAYRPTAPTPSGTDT
ncbi:hypothetical protein GCM10010308_63540 [Streptomyces vinaceusdrappus]|nr:hypothetical protein GCM10010308_63540 [Streptomyces vinaceusdrappus]